MTARKRTPPSVARELGAITARLDMLEPKLDRLGEKLDAVVAIKSDVAAMRKEIDEEIRPKTDDYTTLKNRGLGIYLVLLLFGTVFGGVILKKLFGVEVG